jgi:hypothetical protein
LFDKAGTADPELARLEQVLGGFEYRGKLPQLPRRRAPARRVWLAVGTVAAAAAIAFALVRLVPPRAGWPASIRGDGATCDGQPIAGEARLPVGAWLETGASSARLTVAELGTVELAPGSRARIVATSAAEHVVRLERGTLDARIDAPPRRFVVETARVRVIDLGCAFTVTVDGAGVGRVSVVAGRVALADAEGRETVVPTGAACALTASGPGEVELPAPARENEHAQTPSPGAPTAPAQAPSPQTPSPQTASPLTPSPQTPSPQTAPPQSASPQASSRPGKHAPASHAHASKPAHAPTGKHASKPPASVAPKSAAPAAPATPKPAGKIAAPPHDDRVRIQHDARQSLERSAE